MTAPARPSDPLLPVRVLGRRDAGGGMTLFTLEVAERLRDSYAHPGQYAYFELGAEQGFFVLAGREKLAPWEVLVRGGGLADAMLQAPDGVTLGASPALGHGFPVEQARGSAATIVVTAGSFAAARAAVFRRMDEGDATRTQLVVGARAAEDIPLRGEIDAMREVGVDVHVVISSAQGYVQHWLPRVWRAAGGWVFVAGARPMMEAVMDAAIALGAPSERVVSNV
jgi:ferredoxin-NADP reductase